MITILIIAACGIGLWFFWQNQNGKKRTPQKPSPKAAVSDFASVELRCSNTACKTARRLRGQPILAVEAPVLPLASCDAESCHCSYHKIDDRRQEIGRRTSDHGIEPLIYDGAEHRSASDRRT